MGKIHFCDSLWVRRDSLGWQRINSPNNQSAVQGSPDGQLHEASWGQGHDGEVPAMWGSVISEYTSRQLSVASDRLAAFAGISQMFQTKKTGQYLAGIWRSV